MNTQQVPAESWRTRMRSILLILGAGFGIMLGCGPILFYTFGVMVQPIANATGWDRAHIASVGGVTAIIFGLMSPAVGALLDRVKPRRMAMMGTLAFGTGLALIGWFPHSAGAFVVVVGVAAALGTLQLPHAYNYVIVGAFEKGRGLALGIALSFAGIGIALAAPYAAYLTRTFDWRTAYMLMGLTVALIGFPNAIWLIKDPVVEKGPAQRSASTGRTLSEAMRDSQFWILLVAFAFIAAAVGAATVHMPVVLGDRGVSGKVAAAAVSIIGIATIVARMTFGAALDRANPAYVTAFVFLWPAIGLLLLSVDGDATMVVVSAILVGVGVGVEVDAVSFLSVRAFGLKHFGKIFGLLFLAICIGTGIGPIIIAFLSKQFGYPMALRSASVFGLCAALLIATLGRRQMSDSAALPIPAGVRK